MRLFLLALRNLMRNKRRTMLTALAIVIGAAALVVLQGFAKSLLDVMVEIIVLSKSGAIQVHRRDHIGSDNPLKLTMPHDPALVAEPDGRGRDERAWQPHRAVRSRPWPAGVPAR